MAGFDIEEFSFDKYRLDRWPNSPGLRHRLRLYRITDGDKEIHLQARDLEVLEQLLVVVPAGATVRTGVIAKAVWRNPQNINNVLHSISALREGLEDRQPYRIIGTRRDEGYAILPAIKKTTRHERNPDLLYVDAGASTDQEDIEDAFDEFFGVSMPDHDGVLILQSDLMDSVLPDSGNLREHAQPKSRLYKARTFVNTFDLQGALSVQEAFQRHHRKSPRLIVRDHSDKNSSYHEAVFKISMGLGFSDATTKALQNRTCGPWMSISRIGGDALSIREDLFPGFTKADIKSEPDPERPGFLRILPSDWNNKYVEKWIQMLPPVNGPDVDDYALIFRNTRPGIQRQVLFVVAGFTERSTSLAGQYLSANWTRLWARHVRQSPYTGTLGDFLLVIRGPSDIDRISEWSEVPEFEITPNVLRQLNVDCEWSSRLSPNS